MDLCQFSCTVLSWKTLARSVVYEMHLCHIDCGGRMELGAMYRLHHYIEV